MAEQSKILDRVRKQAILPFGSGAWIDNVLAARGDEGSDLAAAKVALRSFIDSGLRREDLCALAMWVARESVFELLFILGDGSLDSAQLRGLHEQL